MAYTEARLKDVEYPYNSSVIGFTGTQHGLTVIQYKILYAFLLRSIEKCTEAHHGCCIGADEAFHWICKSLGIEIVLHPPDKSAKIGDIRGPVLLAVHPKPYLERNVDIAEASTMMIVCPGEMTERVRSGTWYTKRQSVLRRVPILIIYPDGTISDEVGSTIDGNLILRLWYSIDNQPK